MNNLLITDDNAVNEILKNPGKRWWRERLSELEVELTPEYIETASLEIQGLVMADPAFSKAGTVMLYASTPREVSTELLMRECIAAGKRLCVPLCTDLSEHVMEAIEIFGPDDLEEGAYGIREPKRDRIGETSPSEGREKSPKSGETSPLAIVDPGDIDYVVCPCISCDMSGNRLGHGAGYYDRWLANYEGRKVALCFGKLLQYELPCEENDVRMDEVIVERN